MRRKSKFIITVFLLSLLVSYIVIALININVIRQTIQKQITSAVEYTASQISEIIERKFYEDALNYKETIDIQKTVEKTCGINGCDPLMVLKDIRSKVEVDFTNKEIIRLGIVDKSKNSIVIVNEDQGSSSNFTLKVDQNFFERMVQIVSFNNMIVESESEYSQGEVVYLYQATDSQYIILNRPLSIIDKFISEIPIKQKKNILVFGYQKEETLDNFHNGFIYFNEENKINEMSFIDLIKSNNSDQDVQDIINTISNRQSKIYLLSIKGTTSLVYLEPLLSENSIDYFAYITPNSVINALVSELEMTTIILSSISIIILLIFIYLSYILIEKRANDSNIVRLLKNETKSYVIEVRGNGNVVYYNHAYKNVVMKPIKNINEFNYCDENSFDSSRQTYEPLLVKEKSRDGTDIYIRFAVLRKYKHYELIGINVTKEINQTNLITDMAFKDYLTAHSNRNALIVALDEILDDFNHEKKNSLIVLNILHFKNINNLFGRDFGDLVLKHIPEMIKKELDDKGTIYRFDVDNFGVLLKDIESYAYTIDVAKRLLFSFSKTTTISGNDLKLQIKLGIYNIQKDSTLDMSPTKIIANAFLAVNYIKESKRADYYVYDRNLEMSYTKDDVMGKDLKQALVNHEFEVYYQPQYSLKYRKIMGFEALIRWKNPKYRDESPLKYIEIAEKNGMIIEIGQFVIESALAFAQKIKDKGVHVSLNVSPVQLFQVGFVADFIKQYRKYDLPRDLISIEITETYLINNFEEVTQKLKILQEEGIHIHLDDFGSGYSSMQYFKYLPINAIKIDREFTKGIETDRYSRVIVSKLLAMAKDLDLYAIVEGVETPYELNYLDKINCEIIQGFIVGYAVPEEQAINVLNDFDLTKRLDTLKKAKKNV